MFIVWIVNDYNTSKIYYSYIRSKLQQILIKHAYNDGFLIKYVMNRNRLTANTLPTVLFVDMNSFFASCEQQENYWRGVVRWGYACIPDARAAL